MASRQPIKTPGAFRECRVGSIDGDFTPARTGAKRFFDEGICGGPRIGATALSYAPNTPNAGVYAVTALLVAGFGSLIWLRLRSKTNQAAAIVS